MTTWSLPQHPNLPLTCPRKQDTGTKDNSETAVLWERGPGRGSASGCRQCYPQLQTTRTCPRGLQESWLVRSGEPGGRKPRGHHTAEAPGLCRMPPDPRACGRPFTGSSRSLGSRAGEGAAEDPGPGPLAAPQAGTEAGGGAVTPTDKETGCGPTP